MILVLQTTTFSARGGIPAYNRMVCRALNELAGSGAAREARVLIATDGQTDAARESNNLVMLSLEAFGGNRRAFVRRAIATVLKQRIDLLLLGHVNYAPLGMMLKRLRPTLRYGVMVHGVEVWSRLPLIKRRALQQADLVISVSEYTKEQLVEVNGVQPERVRILPNTIDWKDDESLESRVSSVESDKEAIRLLSVCRLEASEKYKGIDTMIEALPEIIDRVPNVQYVVIGSGSDLERHRGLAEEKGISARVSFLGSVGEATLREAFAACDIFVLPSAGEGFGIVFLEAMHYRKPIVAANSGAAPEVVKNNQTGLIVEYGNPKELAHAIVKLCLDKGLRNDLGAAGYQRLQENFTFDRFQARLSEIVSSEVVKDYSIRRASKAGAGVAA